MAPYPYLYRKRVSRPGGVQCTVAAAAACSAKSRAVPNRRQRRYSELQSTLRPWQPADACTWPAETACAHLALAHQPPPLQRARTDLNIATFASWSGVVGGSAAVHAATLHRPPLPGRHSIALHSVCRRRSCGTRRSVAFWRAETSRTPRTTFAQQQNSIST